MGLIDDKQSIVTDISVFSSIGKTPKLPDQKNTYPSISNKNEPVPFMLDLLTACIGSEALQRTTGNVMTGFIRNVEPNLKTSLKKQSVSYNSNQPLPSGFASGYGVPVNKIDLFNKLKVDPASSSGSLLYGGTPNTFDKAAYNAISSPGSDVVFGNIKMNYDSSLDHMVIKPLNASDNTGSFVNSYIDNLKLVDEKEFTTNVMEAIYGTTSNVNKKKSNTLVEEEKMRLLIKKLLNGDKVEISDEELQALQIAAANKVNGNVQVDVGCSIIDSNVSLDQLAALIASNTGSTDPVHVGNNYNTLMENSFGKNPAQVNPQNKNAVRDGFFKHLIDTITQTIVMALTSTPQIRVLTLLLTGFKNNGNFGFPTNIVDDINAHKNFAQCLATDASALMNQFIFNLLKTELLKIVIPVVSIIIQEKIQAFIRIIQSLF